MIVLGIYLVPLNGNLAPNPNNLLGQPNIHVPLPPIGHPRFIYCDTSHNMFGRHVIFHQLHGIVKDLIIVYENNAGVVVSRRFPEVTRIGNSTTIITIDLQ